MPNFIDTNKRVTDVKLKFQFRVSGCPLKSVLLAGVRSSPALDAALTGRGSYHVTLPLSEIEDYSHLHSQYCSNGEMFADKEVNSTVNKVLFH